jgi:hypothetical protein
VSNASNRFFDGLVTARAVEKQRLEDAEKAVEDVENQLAIHIARVLGIECGKTVVKCGGQRYLVESVAFLDWIGGPKLDMDWLDLSCRKIKKDGQLYRTTTKIRGGEVREIEPDHYSEEVQP